MSEEKKVELKPMELKTSDLLIMLSEQWSDWQRHYVVDRYRMQEEDPELTGVKHRILVGNAVKIAKKVIANGGTNTDVEKVLEYLMVCIDARKAKLDVKDCWEDLGIAEIKRKYSKGKQTESNRRVLKERKMQLDRAAKKQRVLELHSDGKSNEEIAKEMVIPESTVRFFLKNAE